MPSYTFAKEVTPVLLLAQLLPATLAQGADPVCAVTQDEIAAISMNMTYAQVKAKFGCEGKHIGHNSIGDVQIETYGWPGKASTFSAFVGVFYNDSLQKTSEVGLDLSLTPSQ